MQKQDAKCKTEIKSPGAHLICWISPILTFLVAASAWQTVRWGSPISGCNRKGGRRGADRAHLERPCGRFAARRNRSTSVAPNSNRCLSGVIFPRQFVWVRMSQNNAINLNPKMNAKINPVQVGLDIAQASLPLHCPKRQPGAGQYRDRPGWSRNSRSGFDSRDAQAPDPSQPPPETDSSSQPKLS